MINIGSFYTISIPYSAYSRLTQKLEIEDNHKSYANFRTKGRDFEGVNKMKLMKDTREISYDIGTFSIKSSTYWISKCRDLSQKKIVRYTGISCSEIQLTDIQQLTTNSYKIKIDNKILTNVKFQHKNRNNTKVRNFVILLFSNLMAINPVQHCSESHNYNENK